MNFEEVADLLGRLLDERAYNLSDHKDNNGLCVSSDTCVGKLVDWRKTLCERTFKQELPVEYPRRLLDVLRAIRDAGGIGIIIGGAVRDALIGKVGKDVDVEVYGLSGDRMLDVLGKFGHVNAVGKSFGVYKLKLDGTEFDFSIPRRERKTGTGHRGFTVDVDHNLSYVDAAKRRDFTINTLGYDPLTHTVYDPHGGLADIKKGVIRMTDPSVFRDDPLRVLRMAQFASRFGFDVDPETLGYAKVSPEVETLPSERIFEEFKKAILRSKKPGTFIKVLKDADVINKLFPELKGHEEGIAKLMDLMVNYRVGNMESDIVLGLLALTVSLSLRDAIKVLSRLTNEVSIHSRVKNLHTVLHGRDVLPSSDEDIRRLLVKVDAANVDLLKSMAEILFGDRAATFNRKVDLLRGTVQPIVLGRHLMDLGVAPGPMIGRLMRKLHDLQLRGEFSDLEHGIEKAKELIATGIKENARSIDDLLFELQESVSENMEL